ASRSSARSNSAARGRTRPPGAAARCGRSAGRSARPPPLTRPPTPPPAPPSVVLPWLPLSGTPDRGYCSNYGCRINQRRQWPGRAPARNRLTSPPLNHRPPPHALTLIPQTNKPLGGGAACEDLPHSDLNNTARLDARQHNLAAAAENQGDV